MTASYSDACKLAKRLADSTGIDHHVYQKNSGGWLNVDGYDVSIRTVLNNRPLPIIATFRPRICPVCCDAACETRSRLCGK
jgi:hypothetical protein